MDHLVVIGNDNCGVTATRHAGKYSEISITLISATLHYFHKLASLLYISTAHRTQGESLTYMDQFLRKDGVNPPQGFSIKTINIRQCFCRVDHQEVSSGQKGIASRSGNKDMPRRCSDPAWISLCGFFLAGQMICF